MPPAIEVRDLRVIRGKRLVLRDLSFAVAAGRVTGLLGPSGSGKSTLMRAIVGVQRVEAGAVVVLGQPAGSRALRRRVAYVTQAASVYGDLSVSENLRFFAAMLGVSGRSAREAIDTVAMTDEADRLVRDLSGGQRSRVSLATALLGEPEVLVLDEPTVGLDPLLRRDLWDTFRRLAGEGRTLLISSHVMDEAGRCDELLLLREGGLLAREAPARLLARTGAQTLDEAFLRLVEARGPR